MSALFDAPHPAHFRHTTPCLWYGVVLNPLNNRLQAIVGLADGKLTHVDLDEVTADVRHITQRKDIIIGAEGPGWVDLEDLEAATRGDAIRSALASDEETQTMSGILKEPKEGIDFITDREGVQFDPKTGRELPAE